MSVVVGWRDDQLGGRLTAFLYAWQLAKFLGTDLAWVWPVHSNDTTDDYTLSHLFDEPAIGRLAASDGVRIFGTMTELLEAYGDRAAPNTGLPALQALQRIENGEALDDEVIWYNRTGPALHRRDLQGREASKPEDLFKALVLHPAIQNALDDVNARINLSNTVGLHLRRGDIIRSVFFDPLRRVIVEPDGGPIRGFVGRFLPLATAKRMLEMEHRKKRRIVLFSDGLDDRRHMEAYYGAQVVDVHTALDEYPLLPVQRAFCEMILLGRTHRAYGSRSHYLGCASIVGGCRVIQLNNSIIVEELVAEIKEFLARSPHTEADRQIIYANLLSEYRRYFERKTRDGTPQIEAIDMELERIGQAVR